MRHGLIAEWFRGIAGRGLVTAALLAVPVAVAANIGFGGASGLSSVAAGPSESSLASVSAPPATGRGIESLNASAIAPPAETLPGPEATEGSVTTGGGSGSSFVGGGTAPSGSGSSGESGGGGSTGGGTAPAQQPTGGGDTGVGVGAPADPGGGQGLLQQLLQGLNLGQ